VDRRTLLKNVGLLAIGGAAGAGVISKAFGGTVSDVQTNLTDAANAANAEIDALSSELQTADSEVATLTAENADLQAQLDALTQHPVETHVLYQSKTVNAPALAVIMAYTGVTTIAHCVGWDAIEKSPGSYDWSPLDTGAALARQLDCGYAPRIRGGVHTPIEHKGRTLQVTSGGPAQGDVIPVPVNPDGSPNEEWLDGYRALVASYDAWCKANLIDVDGPVHNTWFGAAANELYCTPELYALPGVNDATMAAAYKENLHVVASMTTPLPVELPISGLAQGFAGLKTLQTALVAEMQLVNATRVVYDQRNGFSDGTSSGAWPTSEGPIPPHALQMVKATPTDGRAFFNWSTQVYPRAKTSLSIVKGKRYLEVYFESFNAPGSADLVSAAAQFYQPVAA
jgi:hypothetical protein